MGRSAPLELADDEVSGRHLRIRASGGRVTVADAGSTNGTVVAGERLSADLVRVGNDAGSIRQRLAELNAVLESRRPGLELAESPTVPDKPGSGRAGGEAREQHGATARQ